MIVVKYARQQSKTGLRIDKTQASLFYEVDMGNFYYYGYWPSLIHFKSYLILIMYFTVGMVSFKMKKMVLKDVQDSTLQ